jgi:hypothetical protein|mmetsp:Transcript_56192/g.93397  ORF Transcript_56192/g.93397 Transcript_56192/m.93397 type:complete len:81 (-) Transcript_56192:427-669(-)
MFVCFFAHGELGILGCSLDVVSCPSCIAEGEYKAESQDESGTEEATQHHTTGCAVKGRGRNWRDHVVPRIHSLMDACERI